MPSTSHVTSGFVGSSTRPSRAAGSEQSRDWNSSVSSGVIQARSVGSFGVVAPAGGLAVGDGFARGRARRRARRALGDGVAAVSASGTALLLVGEALLAVVGVADADGDGLGEPVAVPLGDGVGCGTPGASRRARAGTAAGRTC